MAILKSKINPKSSSFLKNKEEMEKLVAELEKQLEKTREQGGEKHKQRAKESGKFLARERIELLLDQDSFFLELLTLAGLEEKGGFGVGGTVVTGIGLVEGKLTLINANIGTLKGGAFDYSTLKKTLRINEIAYENSLPVITIVESGGANLTDQDKVFNYGGIMFRELTRRSKAGLTSIAIVTGSATAGGAYVPGMSDYAIAVKQQAKIFLAGPPLVKMATREETDEESLGGAEMHSKISGVSDYLAEDELDAIQYARQLMKYVKPADSIAPAIADFKEPRYASEEILGVVSADVKVPYDCRELIARIIDDSDFTEFKPDFGTTLVTGWATIGGYKTGIIANNGVIFSDSANKGAHFIQLCNQNNVPILFLQNITGFMVGKKYEEEGIIKHGAKLINAVSNSETPTITVIVGASYGAGNYAMNGLAYQPNLLFSYPNSKIAVMGGEQLAGVMEIVQREAAAKSGAAVDEDQLNAMKFMIMSEAEKKSSPWYATGQTWDDGIIHPAETRNYLKIAMCVIHNKKFEASGKFGIFRM